MPLSITTQEKGLLSFVYHYLLAVDWARMMHASVVRVFKDTLGGRNGNEKTIKFFYSVEPSSICSM